MGETLQFAGDKDAHVHYLLSGAVVLESENDAKTVSAEEDDAKLPLDRAGVKSHTIMAASDAEVLRVPFDSLPSRVFLGDTSPIPTAFSDPRPYSAMTQRLLHSPNCQLPPIAYCRSLKSCATIRDQIISTSAISPPLTTRSAASRATSNSDFVPMSIR